MWKILLVDDEEPIRKLLKAVLELEGFHITTAASAQAAVDVLRKQNFDAVVTDLRMETQLAGFDVVRFAYSLNPRPLAVIVTAFPIPASEWRKAGADALFTKGAETLQLGKRLDTLLKSKPTASPTHPTHLHQRW